MGKSEILPTTTTKNMVKTVIKTFFLSAVIVSAIAVTFVHEYFPNVSKEYVEHKKKYKPIIKNRDLAIETLLTQLQQQQISKEIFITKFREVKTTSLNEIKEYNKIKKGIIAKNSYMGYTSFKNFLFGICFPVCGLVLSLLFLNVNINPVYQKDRKKFYIIVSFIFIACFGYWVSWSFISNSQDPNRPFDFPKLYYNIALYILPIVVCISAYYLMKYYASIEEKLKIMLRPFFDFFYRDADEKKLIRPEKKDEFNKITVELTNHVVNNE